MRYGQIRKMDIANGPGIRTSVFVTGCTHHCYNCFNEEYQNPEFGTLWTDKETDQVISYLKEPTISGLTLLGGIYGFIPGMFMKSLLRTKAEKPCWNFVMYW